MLVALEEMGKITSKQIWEFTIMLDVPLNIMK